MVIIIIIIDGENYFYYNNLAFIQYCLPLQSSHNIVSSVSLNITIFFVVVATYLVIFYRQVWNRATFLNRISPENASTEVVSIVLIGNGEKSNIFAVFGSKAAWPDEVLA